MTVPVFATERDPVARLEGEPRLDTDEEVLEACYRTRDIPVARKQEQEAELAREAEERANPPPRICSFCCKPPPSGMLMVEGRGGSCICEKCHIEVGEYMVEVRSQRHDRADG
jgi:hypothetical protein